MSILFSVAASLLLSYGGAYGAEAVLDRYVSADQNAAEEPVHRSWGEPAALSELTEGVYREQ
jgi:hypothetical protein